MLSSLYFLLIVVGCWLSGWFGVTVFFSHRTSIEKVGLAFLFATNCMTYAQFILFAFSGIQFTLLASIQMMLIFFLGSLVIFVLKYQVELRQSPFLLRHFWQKQCKAYKSLCSDKMVLLVVLAVAVLILFTLIQNMFWPLVDWDALALYDFSAKVMLITGGLADGIRRGYFLQYPLYTSVLHFWGYVVGFEHVKVWYSGIYISLLAVFYSQLRRNMSQKKALLGTLILAISPRILQHAQMAYTNLPYATFVGLGYIYLLQWVTDADDDNAMWLGGMLVAASTWIRSSDPFWIPAIGLLILGVVIKRKNIVQVLILIALIYLYKRPWDTYVLRQLSSNVISPTQALTGVPLSKGIFPLIIRMGEVFSYLKSSVWPVLQPYGILTLFAGIYSIVTRRWKSIFVLLFWIGMLAFVFIGTFVFSYEFSGWQSIPDSAARMAMVMIPVTIYSIFIVPIKLTSARQMKKTLK